MTDLLQIHRRVMEQSVAIVNHVTIDDLARPTPCEGWTLRDLLAHMMGQNYGFAAAARARQDRSAFAPRPVGSDPAGEYQASATRVVDAFSTPGLLDGHMYLPEVRDGMVLPAVTAVEFHVVDYVVHAWDVARTIGVSIEYDDDILQVARRIAEEVPDTAKSPEPHTPFGPALRTTSGAALDQIVAMLGRSPEWRPTL
ncbi:MAG: TIGR03086 family protein [Chloroflexi bacterium]|nr:TIGR03086 family protein [Chloroflexota bacterium]